MTQEGIEISTGHGFMSQNPIFKISNGQIFIYRGITLLRVSIKQTINYLKFTPVLYYITETSHYSPFMCACFPSYSHTHKHRVCMTQKIT